MIEHKKDLRADRDLGDLPFGCGRSYRGVSADVAPRDVTGTPKATSRQALERLVNRFALLRKEFRP
jgi:hypothetical protein